MKMHKNSTLFDVQSAGNRITEPLDFRFFWGGRACSPAPLSEKGRREVSYTGVLITASYRQSTATCGTSYRRLFGFLCFAQGPLLRH